jgi:hypothetical protein
VTARHFTVEEANALLGSVRPLVERMVEQRRALGDALQRREQLAGLIGSNGGGFNPRLPAEVDAAVEAAAQGIKRCVEELTGLGVQVKDLDTGLVDFPSIRNGEEVLLCWQLGEEEIGWWHTLEGGFAGRRPL